MARVSAPPKRSAPPGLDFVPVAESPPNLTFGVVRRQINHGPLQSTHDAILRRLRPGAATNISEPWRPTCYRWDVLLPPQAPDGCHDPKALCDLYETQSHDELKDLVVMATLRFPYPDRLHHAWERVRSFAREQLCEKRRIAVVAAMHLPIEIGSTNPPHVHLMALAREMNCIGFGAYVRPLASDQGMKILVDELEEWLPEVIAA